MMERIPLALFLDRLRAQGVERSDLAFKCPICATVQSMRSLIRAGAGATDAEVESYLGFSCVGRWTEAGPHQTGAAPGRGCDWTLGGLFKLHALEVLADDGHAQPHFAPASPEEAKALAATLPAGEGWLPIDTGPHDGSTVDLWNVHPNAKWSKDPVGEGWAVAAEGFWTDFNGGGWTWNGPTGVNTHWRPKAVR